MKRKKEIKILPIAEEDLAEILDFIYMDKPSAAESFLNRIEKTINGLADNPFSGRAAKEKELSKLGYRFLVAGNYLIFYVVGDDVVIHRILHGARDYISLLT